MINNKASCNGHVIAEVISPIWVWGVDYALVRGEIEYFHHDLQTCKQF